MVSPARGAGRAIRRFSAPAKKLQEGIDKFETMLASATGVTLTTDMWKSMAIEGYLTATAHFIDQTWELKSVVVEKCWIRTAPACIAFRGSCLGVIPPSLYLLIQISSYLPKKKHFLRLADQLGLSEEFRKRLDKERLDGTPANSAPFKWKEKKSTKPQETCFFMFLLP